MLVGPVVMALLVMGVVVLAGRRRGASPTAVLLRRTGFALVATSFVLGGLFVAGEAFADPGGWAAVGLTAAWLVPVAAGAALVRWRTDLAVRVLEGCVAVMLGLGLWYAVAPDSWRAFEDDHGPVRAIATFVLAALLGLLGLTRTRVAGVLLLVLGLGPVLLASAGSPRGMPSLVAAATTPVVVGVLYLGSARFADKEEQPLGYGPHEDQRERPRTKKDPSR